MPIQRLDSAGPSVVVVVVLFDLDHENFVSPVMTAVGAKVMRQPHFRTLGADVCACPSGPLVRATHSPLCTGYFLRRYGHGSLVQICCVGWRLAFRHASYHSAHEGIGNMENLPFLHRQGGVQLFPRFKRFAGLKVGAANAVGC